MGKEERRPAGAKASAVPAALDGTTFSFMANRPGAAQDAAPEAMGPVLDGLFELK